MADRRMIHKAVICSDAFMDMSYEAQALFFQLQIEADAYGLLSSVKRILRSVGVQESTLQELEQAGFIISFGNGVIALRHWNVANTRKNDRTEKALFPRELAMLTEDENKVYHLLESDGIRLESDGIQSIPMLRQRSLAELSVAQPSVAQHSVAEKSESVNGTPSPEQVKEWLTAYAKDQNVRFDISKMTLDFFDYYNMRGWKMADGNDVQNWESAVRRWASGEKDPDKKPKPVTRVKEWF